VCPPNARWVSLAAARRARERSRAGESRGSLLPSLDAFDLNSLAAENWMPSLDVAVLCHQQR